MVTTSTTTLAFKWPSALIAQLVVSIRHIADLASKSLGADRVPLAESAHKRTRSKESLNTGRRAWQGRLGNPERGPPSVLDSLRNSYCDELAF